MPVTFSPTKNSAEPWRDPLKHHTPIDILQGAYPKHFEAGNKLLQSSFEPTGCDDIVPSGNGFVHTILEAYNQHRALIIRPDDVWLAILIQFSLFVNQNAEAQRRQFVSHTGKKELTVEVDVRETRAVDFGQMASEMTKEIHKNVVDPSLRAWILPDFTTTTANDTITSSIVMMATMKAYFSYKFCLLCGIPRVTLQGEKVDWEKILTRLAKLKEYGPQTIAWYYMLRPIISQFVRAFDTPHAEENLEFWNQVAHYESGGSGPTYLSGWVTAFCVFDEKGTFQKSTASSRMRPRFDSLSHLELSGTSYPRIDSQDVPQSYAQVDVLIDCKIKGFESKIKSVMMAGQVGMRVSSSGVKKAQHDVISPVAGWWILAKKPEGQLKKLGRESNHDSMSESQLSVNNKPTSQTHRWRLINAQTFIYQGSIETMNVDSDDLSELEFVAISYTWSLGMIEWRERILSLGGDHGYENKMSKGSAGISSILASRNVEDQRIIDAHRFFTSVALLVLTRGQTFFWMDIISIDQDSHEEKGYFVPRMGSVYRQATETHSYITGSIPLKDISCQELYFPAYETRVWTLQEVIMSKNVLHCYCFDGDFGNRLVTKVMTCKEIKLDTLVVEKYRYLQDDTRYCIVWGKERLMTCFVERESPLGGLPFDSYLDKHMFGSQFNQALGRNTMYKVLTKVRHNYTKQGAIAVSMILLGGRESTLPEDKVYSMLGLLEMENFELNYGEGFEEARIRMFEAMKPDVLGMIMGTDWGHSGNTKLRDSALPRIIGSCPTSGIELLETTIQPKYSRDIGTSVYARTERCRIWADSSRRQTKSLSVTQALMGTSSLAILFCVSLLDSPGCADKPTSEIPDEEIHPIILAGRFSDEELAQRSFRYDREVELVEIGKCLSHHLLADAEDMEIMRRTALLTLECERTESGQLTNRGTVLLLNASRLSTEFSMNVVV